MKRAAPLNSTKKTTKTAKATIHPASRSSVSQVICTPSARTTSFAELEYPKRIESLIIDNTKITSFIGAKQLSTLTSFSCKNTTLEHEKYLDVMCLITFGTQLKKVNGTLIPDRKRNIATKYSQLLLPFLLEGYLIYSLKPDVQIYTKSEETTYVYPITEEDAQLFVEKNNEIAQNEEELKELREKLENLQQELGITLDPRKTVKPQILRSTMRRKKSSTKSSTINPSSSSEKIETENISTKTENEISSIEQTTDNIETKAEEIVEDKQEEIIEEPKPVSLENNNNIEEPTQKEEEPNPEQVPEPEKEQEPEPEKEPEQESEPKQESEPESEKEQKEEEEDIQQKDEDKTVHYAPRHAAAESAYAHAPEEEEFNPLENPFPEGRTVRTPVAPPDNSDSQEIFDMLYKSGSDDDDEDLYPPM